MAQVDRPLSPHIQVYRPQLTTMLSIGNRATGVALSIGAILLIYWLVSAASGPYAFERAQSLIGSWLGIVLLLGWSFSLFWHLAMGIRHLAWDTGWGLDIETTYTTGWIAIGGSVVLTVIAWIAGFIIWAHS